MSPPFVASALFAVVVLAASVASAAPGAFDESGTLKAASLKIAPWLQSRLNAGGEDSFLVLFNGWRDRLTFTLTPVRFGRRFDLELSTTEPELEAGSWVMRARDQVEVEGRSILLLRRAG